MSERYETANKPQTTTRPQAAKTPDHASKGRVRASEDVLGAGPEVVLNAVPKGRTAQIEAAIATTLRSDEGFGGALGVWGEGLDAMATTYSANRDAVAELYIAHGAKSPSSSVGQILHGQRKAALASEYEAYTTLAMETQNAAISSGPTFAIIELADKSHKELMGALVGSGQAKQQKGTVIVDGAQVQAESRFHLQAEKEGYIHPRSKVMAQPGQGLGEAHEDIAGAITGANAATAKLRSRAFLASAEKDQQELQRQETLFGLCNLVDQTLGGLGQLTNAAAMVDGGISQDGVASGTGLVSRVSQWIAGGKLSELRGKIASQKDLAGMEDNRADLIGMEEELKDLERSIRRFAKRAAEAEAAKEEHRAARGLDGARLDVAARGRAELGPRSELHVPIADRLARIESAAAFNLQAQAATSRFLETLVAPADLAEKVRVWIKSPDLEKVRSALPPNYFLVMIRNLTALQGELGARASILQQLGVQ